MQSVNSYNAFCLKKQEILMNRDELPGRFDLVVIGTGLEESLLAAAASRNGHSVLHLDSNDYYGRQWAAFSFDGFQKWIQSDLNTEEDPNPGDEDHESLIRLNPEADFEAEQIWHIPEDDEKRGKIAENSRHFNIDLCPRLLFSRGSMVELLISSNVSRYTEFKAVSRVLTFGSDGKSLQHVPSSRSDVFATKQITVVEKRILMKFLSAVATTATATTTQQQQQDVEDERRMSFKEYLKKEKLTDNLIHYVIHSIAMVDETSDSRFGLEMTKKFLGSLGRFGNTPFLWSMYGSGELPQAFCRLAAVFGATYYLGRSVDGIRIRGDKVEGVKVGGREISCDRLIMSANLCPDRICEGEKNVRVVDRRICLLTESILPGEREQLTFLSVPSPRKAGYTYVQEVGFGAAACPRGMYTLHLSAKDQIDPDVVRSLLGENNDKLLWSAKFKLKSATKQSKLSNLTLCSGPLFELDYDEAIANAKKHFRDIFGDEEFLPRAPDPEEIIIGEPEEEQPQEEDKADGDGNDGQPADLAAECIGQVPEPKQSKE